VLEIEVQAPVRSSSAYEFTATVRERRPLRDRLRSPRTTGDPVRSRFGYRASNFEIRHHEAWDGFYALFFLTRNSGPIFGHHHEQARIKLHFPIASVVRDFFIRRARDLGYQVSVEAPTAQLAVDRDTQGHVLAFGGGKESRLILGMLREQRIDPTVVTSMPGRARDIPGVLHTESLSGAIANRLMPALMLLGRHAYYGAGLGEAHLRTPWQQHYDLASRRGRDQLSGLLAAVGVATEIHAPTVVLPANITQRILHDRYPQLYAGQISTRPDAASDKNLHVALIKLLHGLEWQDRMEEPLFRRLLEDFVDRQLVDPPDFGFRDAYQAPAREMRAIAWRLRTHEALATVRERIPPDWDDDWIDDVHDYVDPGLDPAFLAMFTQHARTVELADPDAPIQRIET